MIEDFWRRWSGYSRRRSPGSEAWVVSVHELLNKLRGQRILSASSTS
jgi:hypothetical protein